MGEEERLLEEDHGGSDKDEWEDDNEGLLITPKIPLSCKMGAKQQQEEQNEQFVENYLNRKLETPVIL